jgi:hypothetical protein
VDRNTVAHYRTPAELRRDHYARREQLQRETALPLGVALTIIVLLSLGLWWVILLAGSPLVSALWSR